MRCEKSLICKLQLSVHLKTFQFLFLFCYRVLYDQFIFSFESIGIDPNWSYAEWNDIYQDVCVICFIGLYSLRWWGVVT